MKIISILCWILGVLNIIEGIVFLIHFISIGKPLVVPGIIIAIGSGLCYSGYKIREGRLLAYILAFVFSMFSLLSFPIVGTIIGAVIIIIIPVVLRKKLRNQ